MSAPHTWLTRKSVPFLEERLELGFLVGDPVGRAGLICRARIGRGLLDELADIVSDCVDALVQFDESCSVGHGDSFSREGLLNTF